MIGDIIFFKPKRFNIFQKIQCFFDKTEYVHVGIEVGHKAMLEANIFKKTKVVQIPEDREFVVKRPKILKKELRASVLKYMLFNLDEHYSYLDLAYAILKSVLFKITRGKIDLSNRNFSKSDICSELVYKIYQACGYKIEGITPGDLWREEIFQIVP